MKERTAVCEEVIGTLGIKSCGILTHGAGAPYAPTFALWVSHRMIGSIHLLAPWVGGAFGASVLKVFFFLFQADSRSFSWLPMA